MEAEQADRLVRLALRAADRGGSRRLAALISRYGKAIEWDLAVRGIDLATLWRQRRWRKLLNLISHLPRNSAYMEAVCDDEDLAEQLLNGPDRDSTQPSRRMSEYGAEVELLSILADRIAELIGAVVASRGIKPRKIPPTPRPVTAMERIRKRRRAATHHSLVARLLPHKTAQPIEPAPRPVPKPARRPDPPRRAERDRLRHSGWGRQPP